MVNIYQVYQKYNKDFKRFAKSLTGSEDKAFDLVQDTYLTAIEREDMFTHMNEYQIKGWFFTVIKNKNIDNIRKLNKLLYLDNYEFQGDYNGFEENVALRELLEKLSEENRKIVMLRYQFNYNSVEIGEMLGISPSTVRSRLSASLNKLRENI